MRLKALAASYTMHSFAQICNLLFYVKVCLFQIFLAKFLAEPLRQLASPSPGASSACAGADRRAAKAAHIRGQRDACLRAAEQKLCGKLHKLLGGAQHMSAENRRTEQSEHLNMWQYDAVRQRLHTPTNAQP